MYNMLNYISEIKKVILRFIKSENVLDKILCASFIVHSYKKNEQNSLLISSIINFKQMYENANIFLRQYENVNDSAYTINYKNINYNINNKQLNDDLLDNYEQLNEAMIHFLKM